MMKNLLEEIILSLQFSPSFYPGSCFNNFVKPNQ